MNILRAAMLSGICAALACAGDSVATRTTLVVKTDARSGRLVRSVAVAARVVGPKAELQGADPAQGNEPQTAAEGAATLSGIIDEIALRNDVEGLLVHSVIKAESNYNPLALSPKGAQGLMQLIPSTARRFGVANSFNAQQNIEGGVKYLKFLMELYHNDYVKVIAAYNAGEGAVTKYGGIPPYPETRNYVLQVGKNLKSARTAAELKAVAKAAEKSQVSTQLASAEPQFHPILAVTGADGKVYYKTQ